MRTSLPTLQPEPNLAEAKAIQEFWDAHYAELVRDYPDQFVAVRGGEVIAAGSELSLLVNELGSRGIDARTDVAIEFISLRSGRLVL